MDFEPYFKVHNLVSVHTKSVILGQMINLNMVFHMVMSVYRLVKILKLAPVPWWISERLIEVRKNMRQVEKRQAKKAEETKGYGDYNWKELYKSVNLKKLKVAELNKYIFRHNLWRRKTSKSEKLNLLSAHISKGFWERILTLSAAETAATEDSDTQSEDDDVSVSEDSKSEDELLL